MDVLFDKYDMDKNGIISFDEFIAACHAIIVSTRSMRKPPTVESSVSKDDGDIERSFASSALAAAADEEGEEEEEVPHDLAHLSGDEQQREIKKRAFSMLGFGTFLVLLFSGTSIAV